MNGKYVCFRCQVRRHLSIRSPSIDAVRRTTRPFTTPSTQAEEPRIGRYSRQPLGPQQLLQELERDEVPSTSSSRPSPRPDSAAILRVSRNNVQRPSHVTSPEQESTVPKRPPPNVPAELWAKFRDFLYATDSLEGRPVLDQNVLRALLEIARNYQGTDALETVCSESPRFSIKIYFWLKQHVLVNWHKAVLDNTVADTTVRPSEAIRPILACDLPQSTVYSQALFDLASQALESCFSRHHVSSKQASLLVSELMATWNLLMRRRKDPTTNILRANCQVWSFLPDTAATADSLQRARRARGRNFGRALAMLVPEMKQQHSSPSLPSSMGKAGFQNAEEYKEAACYASAAFITLEVLYQLGRHRHSRDMAESHRPWNDLVQTIFNSVGDERIPWNITQKLSTGEHGELYKRLVSRLALRPWTEQSDAAASPSESPAQFVEKCQARLGRAVEQQNHKAVERLYNETMEFASKTLTNPLPMELYESLMYSFLSLRNAEQTMTVWNELIRVGHRPTAKTYTLLMRASQSARDLKAGEDFWSKMRESGVQPDAYAWSTRIHGLLRGMKSKKAGMQALDAMGREWVAAGRALYAQHTGTLQRAKPSKSAKVAPRSRDQGFENWLAKCTGDIAGVPRPDVHVMNTAIGALAASDDALLPAVLSWGHSFGIEPDIKTYNALMNFSMRHNQPVDAMKLLRRMSDKGIEADSTTWTVLITSMFESGMLDGLDSSQVGERVLAFVQEIDQHHGTLDVKGYALLIDRLLKKYGNVAAAQGMLDRMASKGVKPSPHIYTILMSHHLQQKPPAFDAAEALWTRIRNDNAGYGSVLDRVFFDRMVELYAPHHEAIGMSPILRILDMVESSGKTLSWRAKETLARALAEARDFPRLSSLVERTRREDNEDDVFGRKTFWDFIESTGAFGSRPALRRDSSSSSSPQQGEGVEESRGAVAAQY